MLLSVALNLQISAFNKMLFFVKEEKLVFFKWKKWLNFFSRGLYESRKKISGAKCPMPAS